MAKPFKFRYVREIVGSFMLAIIILLVAGIVLAGRAQGWFEPSMTLRVRIPMADLSGINKGAAVMTLGTKLGVVQKVLVKEDASIEAVLLLKGSFIQFIRSDSQALIKKQFGVAGDSFIELTRGVGSVLEDDLLPTDARKDTELVELAQKLLQDVQEAVLPLLEQVRAAAQQYTELGAGLQNTVASVDVLLGTVNELAAGLNEGEGTAGKLLKDPQTVDEVNLLIESVGGLLSNLNTVVYDVRGVVTNVNGILLETQDTVHNIKRASVGLPAMMQQTEGALGDVELLLQGIQRHWLLRNYIDAPQEQERIPATSAVIIPLERTAQP